jgi:3-hydroxyacyl-CoA dehydrogenase
MAQRHRVVMEQMGDVAVVRLSRPPSNALSAEMCSELSALLLGVMQDASLVGVVITSDLSVFAAGSDVGDLIDPPQGHREELRELCTQVVRAPKPVIAAISGACLSTGLDLALAATGRVAGPQASFGYPDIRLGLLPAAGGAVRLTRAVGAQMALEMLLGGGALASETALDIGLIDQLCAAGAELSQAIDMVRDFVHTPPQPQAQDLAADLTAIADARGKLAATDGPWIAQARMLDVVEAALLLPPATALTAAYAAHDEVQRGEICRALTYAFVARQRGTSEDAARPQIEAELRRTMAQVVAYFEDLAMPRADILGAMAAFGIGMPAGAALPKCPKGAEDVMPALLAAWANLGAKLLRTGAAPRGDAIDLAALSAGMCPNWRGGPIFAADARGTLIMRAQLRRRAADVGGADLFSPDPAWDQMITQGLRLGAYLAQPNRV